MKTWLRNAPVARVRAAPANAAAVAVAVGAAGRERERRPRRHKHADHPRGATLRAPVWARAQLGRAVGEAAGIVRRRAGCDANAGGRRGGAEEEGAAADPSGRARPGRRRHRHRLPDMPGDVRRRGNGEGAPSLQPPLPYPLHRQVALLAPLLPHLPPLSPRPAGRCRRPNQLTAEDSPLCPVIRRRFLSFSSPTEFYISTHKPTYIYTYMNMLAGGGVVELDLGQGHAPNGL